MGKIILEKMQFYAYHGCFAEERVVGTNYELDLILDLDISQAGKTDQLEHTLNYQLVYDVVKAQMAITSNLVEHVAQRIVDSLLSNFSQINQVELSLSKMNPPLGGQLKCVTIKLAEKR